MFFAEKSRKREQNAQGRTHLSKSGRANIQRIETDEDNRPHAESGQRGAIRLCPEP